MWIETPLWQWGEVKMPRQQSNRSRRIWELLQCRDWQPDGPEKRYEEMLNTIGDSLSNLASFENLEHGEDKEADDEDTEPGKLGADDEPSWVLRIIWNTYRSTLRVLGKRRPS